MLKEQMMDIEKKHYCKKFSSKTLGDSGRWWDYYEDDKGRLYSSANGEYVIEVKYCSLCGYNPKKTTKDLIEKFRPTLEKLSKE